jgi:cytochrome P450
MNMVCMSLCIIVLTSYSEFIKGDIVHASLAGTHMIVINSVEVATELLQSRGATYSDRPSSHFHVDLVGWGESPTVMNDGPVVRRFRRHFSQEFGGKPTLGRFTPLINAGLQEFIGKILNESDPSGTLHHHVSAYVYHLATDTRY